MGESDVKFVENQPYSNDDGFRFAAYNFHERENEAGEKKMGCALAVFNQETGEEFPTIVLFEGEEYSVAGYTVAVKQFGKENRTDFVIVSLTNEE